MCARDKALIKKTFHDIKEFITTGPSRLSTSLPRDSPTAGQEAGVIPSRGMSGPPLRTYGRSRSSTQGAGVGAGVPGPPGVPTGLPLGPLPLSLPLPGAPLREGDARQQQQQSLDPALPQPSSSAPSSPGSPGERRKPEGTWRRRNRPSNNNGNKSHKDLGSEKENETFISSNITKIKVTTNTVNEVAENDGFIQPLNNGKHNTGDNDDEYDDTNCSLNDNLGPLVDYSSDSSDSSNPSEETEEEDDRTPDSLPGLVEDYSSDEEGPASDQERDYFDPAHQAQQDAGVRRLEQTLSPASRQRLAEGEWLLSNYTARQFFAFGLKR